MKAIILCAGLGTRLHPITETIPKVMVPIDGKPLLQYHIEWLAGQGITDIGINLFYLPEIITNYFGDGSRFGVKIHYSRQETLSETASGFKKFEKFVGNDRSLVIYGDNFFFLDLKDFEQFHISKNALVSISLKHWEDPTSKGIVGMDDNNRIQWFKEKPTREEVVTDLGNAGIYIVEPEVFSHIPTDRDYDFGRDIFPALLHKGKALHGYTLNEYHVDIGTHDALAKIRSDIHTLYPQRAAFLDRDGVLNIKPAPHDYVKNHDEFSWVHGAHDLVKELSKRGYLTIVVSNQKGIRQGKMSKKFVNELHQRMNTELAATGTHIDAFYYCPHHEDDACACRKPHPGLILRARHDHKINLNKSILIGDSDTDIEAATRAGCAALLIKSNTIDLPAILRHLRD